MHLRRVFLLTFVLLFVVAGESFARDLVLVMGDFRITVTEILWIDGNRHEPLIGLIGSQAEQLRALEGKILTGKGMCSFRQIQLPVIFNDVKATIDISTLTANTISGSAKCDTGLYRGRVLEYLQENCMVKIKTSSLLFTPELCHGDVEVFVPYTIIGVQRLEKLKLTAKKVRIFPDGGVCGDKFRGEGEFVPDRCLYEFRLRDNTDCLVNLGGIEACSDIIRGVTLYGEAERELVKMTYSCHIRSNVKETTYELTFQNAPLSTIPESNYELTLKSGRVRYVYMEKIVFLGPILVPIGSMTYSLPTGERATSISPGFLSRTEIKSERVEMATSIRPRFSPQTKIKLESCEGDFHVTLKLPESVPDMNGDRIIFDDLTLYTDETGALFGKVAVPAFPVPGSVYTIECSDDNGWAFFDLWFSNKSNWDGSKTEIDCGGWGVKFFVIPDTSFPVIPDTSFPERRVGNETQVPEIRSFPHIIEKNVVKASSYLSRPGVSVFSGILTMTAPQTDAIHLHTKFWGCISLWAFGVSGELTSRGYSLVPRNETIVEIEKDVINTTLSEVIAAGNNRPNEKKSIFKLSNLMILRMNIGSVFFCNNHIMESLVNYDVHFPYPSHINVSFVDSTLDDKGVFRRAWGPEMPETYITSTSSLMMDISTNFIDEKWKKEGFEEEESLLWFWRLPINLYNKGVRIDHPIQSDQVVKIAILDADLGISPLTCTEPGHSNGVSFQGNFTSDGRFTVGQYVKTNYFGKNHRRNFDCELDALSIAHYPNDPPDTREADAEWAGSIRFPFFGEKEVAFKVRNIVAIQKNPLPVMENTGELNPSDKITAKVGKLVYDWDNDFFYSDNASYFDALDSSPQIVDAAVSTKSFISSYMIPQNVQTIDKVISQYTTSECGEQLTVVQVVEGCIPGPKDLVCYDAEARAKREAESATQGLGIDLCGDTCYIGTYKVKSTDSQNNTTEILVIEDAMYILSNPSVLLANGSPARFKSDRADNAVPMEFSIPNATLIIDSDGSVEGMINVDADLGDEVPIGVDVKVLFGLDPHCGFFYIFGDVGIKYYIELGGQLLISHHKLSDLRNCSLPICPIGVIASTAYLSEDEFIENGLRGMGDNEVLTGILVGARASLNLALVRFQLGGTFYYFQRKYTQQGGGVDTDIFGANVYGYGKLDLLLFEAVAATTVAGVWEPSANEITLIGKMCLCVCLDVSIGHLKAQLKTPVEFSTSAGLEFHVPDFDFDTGWGECNCCRD